MQPVMGYNGHMSRTKSGALAGLVTMLWLGPALIAGSLSPSIPLPTEDAELTALVTKIEAHYDSVRAFEAEFVQTFERRLIRRTMEESGRVKVKKPGRMRWEYQSPEEKLFITDGEKTYFYLPQEKQVMISHASGGLMTMAEGSPFELLAGNAQLTDTFDYFWSSSEPVLDGEVIELIPLKRQDSFEKVELEVAPKTGQIRRIVLIDAQSNRTEFQFRAMEENREIPDSQFRFAVPAGVEVVLAPSEPPL